MSRGYFGIGIFGAKYEENIGGLMRSAHIFGAAFVFTIGRRYKPQASDTLKAYKHIPCYNYLSLQNFLDNIPYDCRLVCVENHKRAWPIKNFVHFERSVYLLGAEDHGLPEKLTEKHPCIILPGRTCLNVATAGSIVMYDRFTKSSN